ncbi:uncharacterized protein LOC124166443 [Ischnura elegans]|uniref:uncharacterized protein LOC124166443 n=1 Tax=Ischnura elegans TaxID=197161 RepID=UPI001ED8A869|nr:uncharacterized protein LOC124166443 [Ischnura elegans]
MSCNQRSTFVRSKGLCLNCLRPGHWAPKCQARGMRCQRCKRYHHTSLHNSAEDGNSVGANDAGKVSTGLRDDSQEGISLSKTSTTSSIPPAIKSSCTRSDRQHSTILGTAVALIQASNGAWERIRVLIDPGSQLSIISSSAVRRLSLPISAYEGELFGLAHVPLQQPNGQVLCSLSPRHTSSPVLTTRSVVVSEVLNELPTTPIPLYLFKKFAHLRLADPEFDRPAPVEMLLGMDLFPRILLGGRKSLSYANVIAMNSVFGWVIMGSYPTIAPQNPSQVLSLAIGKRETLLLNQLKRFWEVEEVEVEILPRPEDVQCEVGFQNTHRRMPDGRYQVMLPFKACPPTLGDSHGYAITRWMNMERRLSRNSRLKGEYHKFMSEYESLGHMSRSTSPGSYYLPHHAVFKDASQCGQIRVVFDASAKTSLGNSLNDVLETGPKLQKDIFDLLIGFRTHKVAFITDIVKMYRQISLHPDHRTYQHVVFREDPSSSLLDYELNTVTYGVVSSPFLAIRTLHQLASDEGQNFPLASKVLLHDTYVDDIVTGASSIAEALNLQKQLISLLLSGGFSLGKWASNAPELLSHIPEEKRVSILNFDSSDVCLLKVLGMYWSPKSDTFSYHVNFDTVVNSKRKLLSNIARIFDPIGALSPVTLWAKVLMQSLWNEKLSWDDSLPEVIKNQWDNFVSQSQLLQQIKFPRYIFPRSSSEAQLIGFCDASERGYGAVVYIRTIAESEINVHLVAAKSKVAPLKTLSIPRLELMGAYLLSKLLSRLSSFLDKRLQILKIYAWTDSQIVLAWLRMSPHLLKTFVANRITNITASISSSSWRHIESSNNPADCVSRGMMPNQLLLCDLYWSGPEFLREDESKWPSIPSESKYANDLPEVKIQAQWAGAIQDEKGCSCHWMKAYSCYLKLIRTVVFVRRFISGCKGVQRPSNLLILESEWTESLNLIIKLVQECHFKDVLHSISRNKCLHSTFARLSPIIDDQGILRVGGRLINSALPQSQKQPVLLPKESHPSRLIVRHYHFASLHGGPRMVEALIVRKFWIISGRALVRSDLAEEGFQKGRCPSSQTSSPPHLLPEGQTNYGRP